MCFKRMKTNLTFADRFLSSSIQKNRAIKRISQINAVGMVSRTMRKGVRGVELTELEKEHNKLISKMLYIVNRYVDISHRYNKAFRARFARPINDSIDTLFRHTIFNLLRGTGVEKPA